jgi:hypothetical protein
MDQGSGDRHQELDPLLGGRDSGIGAVATAQAVKPRSNPAAMMSPPAVLTTV